MARASESIGVHSRLGHYTNAFDRRIVLKIENPPWSPTWALVSLADWRPFRSEGLRRNRDELAGLNALRKFSKSLGKSPLALRQIHRRVEAAPVPIVRRICHLQRIMHLQRSWGIGKRDLLQRYSSHESCRKNRRFSRMRIEAHEPCCQPVMIRLVRKQQCKSRRHLFSHRERAAESPDRLGPLLCAMIRARFGQT